MKKLFSELGNKYWGWFQQRYFCNFTLLQSLFEFFLNALIFICSIVSYSCVASLLSVSDWEVFSSGRKIVGFPPSYLRPCSTASHSAWSLNNLQQTAGNYKYVFEIGLKRNQAFVAGILCNINWRIIVCYVNCLQAYFHEMENLIINF